VDPDALPDGEDLWWSWVVLAAMHRASGDEACRLDPHTLVLALDNDDGSWLRLQRTLGRRLVLWGRSAVAPELAPDARRGAPDWALSEATEDREPTFFAWHVRGEWDASTAYDDEGALQLLRPVLTVDPRAVGRVRSGQGTVETMVPSLDEEHLAQADALVDAARADAPARPGGSIGSRLRDQIHGQMRDAVETDRMLMQRPPVLVQWSRINGPHVPFEYAVLVTRRRITPAPTNTALPETVTSTLTNVLRGLHHDEASEESGAWLFARVTSDGIVVRFDRAFDSWPDWYQVHHADQGPSLEDLAWEMRQRAREWRPAWASLLPRF
jgi:hypothetical protein